MQMKNLNMTSENSQKCKRGRPCKTTTDVPFDTEPLVDVIEVKRKRGRPRKEVNEDGTKEPEVFFDVVTDEVGLDEKEFRIIEKIKKDKAKEVKEDKKKYYVDTARLRDIILEYYKSDNITDELATCLYNIANRIAYMPNFINYTWREEMVGDGLVKEFLALKNKKFDPLKGRAFSYFSMIVYNAFCNRIKKELKEKLVIKEYQEEQYAILMPNMGNENRPPQNNEDGDYE